MSKEDFQERLNRLGANSHQAHPTPHDQASKPRRETSGIPFGRVGPAGAVFGLGCWALRYANKNYDALVADGSPNTLLVIAAVGVVGVLVGLIMFVRALWRQFVAPSNISGTARQTAQAKKKPSRRAQTIASLFGLALGSLSLFLLAMSVAAHRLETDAGAKIATGFVLIIFLLAALCLLIALIGLFLHGFALWRVPLYYVLGLAMTFAVTWVLRVDMLDWPQLELEIQKLEQEGRFESSTTSD